MPKAGARPAPLPVDDTAGADFVAPHTVTVTVARVGDHGGPAFAAFDVRYAPKEDESASALRKAVSSPVRRNVLAACIHIDEWVECMNTSNFAGGGEDEVDPCVFEIIKHMVRNGDVEPKAKRARKVPAAIARPVLDVISAYKEVRELFREGTRCVTTPAAERTLSLVVQY